TLGLMAATKLELLPTVLVIGLIIAFGLWREFTWQIAARYLAVVGLVGLILVAPWWTRNLVRFHNPVYPAAVAALGISGLDQTTFAPRDTQYVGRGDTFGLPS